MAVLGDKRAAKQYILEHAPEVPLVPGYNGSEQDVGRLSTEADRIGFPVLIKASAGGGGKGMRIVHESSQVAEELRRAQSEAQRSFGSSDCILEKYIEQSKHIEIQILGDSHGDVISLFERECSVQRRHQKIIEEAPSPWLDQPTRDKMSQAAITIGKLISYEGAGTVEFIIDVNTKQFYFLEVNTRIQVEHPITEETTGLDIVALQIYITAGGRIAELTPLNQLVQNGHAIECRLCAEDPVRDFMPDLGRIWRWTPATAILPEAQTMDVRFETGIASGLEVSIYFDSMIAKIVVWAPTRSFAIAKMLNILAKTVCIGVRTNQSFLQACLSHPGFRDPTYSTNFIPENRDKLLRNPYVENPLVLQRLLSFIPSMLFRHPALQREHQIRRRPFQSLPQSFRNQRADTANVQADVVRLPSDEAMLILWSNEGRNQTLADSFTVTLRPLPSDADQLSPSLSNDPELKPSSRIALQYNSTISKTIRSPSHQPSSTHHIYLRTHTTQRFASPTSPTEDWYLYNLSITIDNHAYNVYIATTTNHSTTDAGAHQTVFCHTPALGTPIEFQRFSLLAYGESLRARMQGPDVVAGAERSVKAPMPCKVLNVAVKEGEKVERGAVVMVVESMKTEIKMLAAVEGVYRGKSKEGEAVDEGTVLFEIDVE